MQNNVLEVKNLSKSYGDTPVLRDISFTLGRGEVLVIIGSSGSGKTTLLRCLNFLEEADGGEILVDGEKILGGGEVLSEREKRERRLNFGLVFQSFNLFPQYTVKRNVTLSPEIFETDRLREKYGRGREFREERRSMRESIDKRADDILASVGLSAKANSYPWQLSGGQCQRAAIARALAMSPEVLCFDEPTSALDPELTGEVLRVIRELKTSGRTMIIVTHEMDFAREVGDRIIFMANGIAEADGTPDEVFENERVRSFACAMSAAS